MVLNQDEEVIGDVAAVSIRSIGAHDGVARFAHPTTRMLLTADGLTTPMLEALLSRALSVRVLRQDVVPAGELSGAAAAALCPSDVDELLVRRSCLVDRDAVPVSVNYVVALRHRARQWGVDDPTEPIGHQLLARGVAQRRRLLRVGTGSWLDGRVCATKAYVVLVRDLPLCYIRESFNPDLIVADTDDGVLAIDDWDDEIAARHTGGAGLAAALPRDEQHAAHQPAWPDPPALQRTVRRLESLPPLVSAAECAALTSDLGAAAQGRAFVLHLGDCAETFDFCDTDALLNRQALALAAATVVSFGSGLRPVVLGRIAGEYAKPRSRQIEADTGIASYFGDMVNSHQPDAAARTPDPDRMVRAYFHAAATLNHLRAHPVPPAELAAGVIERAADACGSGPQGRLLRDVAGLLATATAEPARGTGQLDGPLPSLRVSHEALVLDYENALTRRLADDRWWAGSAHLVWIGERTRDLDQAHIRFVERIANPVAVKLGPSATAADVATLCRRLNPHRVPGRLTLIPRLGADRAERLLPPLLEAAAATSIPVVWICDPMHANTFVTDHGHKTRHLDDITAEIAAFFAACRGNGATPAGLHLESAPEPVTECVGGWPGLGERDLAADYRTRCDPRLNPVQTLQAATVLLAELARTHAGSDAGAGESRPLRAFA